jgi:acetoacetate decarboxylase
VEPESFFQSFSLPIGPGPAYLRPPYTYRGVEDAFVAYETDPMGVVALLPPGVTAADDPPICIAWARWIPFSSFGPYHEAYVMVRASFDGAIYLYQPFIFTDNEIPLVAGRELWGYAKKLAVMERSSGGAGSPYGEQLLFTVERPRGQRIMTVSVTCERLCDPTDLDDLPVLSTRLIPHAERDHLPSVAELVRLDVAAHVHRSEDGTPKLWSGRASVSMDSRSQVDPWHLLAPTRVREGYFGVFDFDLDYGRVVFDFLDALGAADDRTAQALTLTE